MGVSSVSAESDEFTFHWQAQPDGTTFYRLELFEPNDRMLNRNLQPQQWPQQWPLLWRAMTNPTYLFMYSSAKICRWPGEERQ